MLEKITSSSVIRQIVEALNQALRKTLSEKEDGKGILQWDFTEKDDLVAYFAAKAGISEDCPKGLDFFFNIQDDPDAVMPSKWTEGSLCSEG